jgi:hypothetical protein
MHKFAPQRTEGTPVFAAVAAAVLDVQPVAVRKHARLRQPEDPDGVLPIYLDPIVIGNLCAIDEIYRILD